MVSCVAPAVPALRRFPRSPQRANRRQRWTSNHQKEGPLNPPTDRRSPWWSPSVAHFMFVQQGTRTTLMLPERPAPPIIVVIFKLPN